MLDHSNNLTEQFFHDLHALATNCHGTVSSLPSLGILELNSYKIKGFITLYSFVASGM